MLYKCFIKQDLQSGWDWEKNKIFTALTYI